MRFFYDRPALFVLLIVLLVSPVSRAETTGRLGAGVDLLERQLELGRHEQLVAVKADPGSLLAEFSTDGCSGGLSAGWEYLAGRIEQFDAALGARPPWESCCVTHDRVYHTGGPREATATESFTARKNADLALQACVRHIGLQRAPELSADYGISGQEVEALYAAIAALMYRAVRVGGMPCTGLPWRWGYGWPECE